MQKIDVKTIRPILKTKKDPQVKDPPRYPQVINAYEDEAKRVFAASLQKMLVDLSKKIFSLKK